MSSVTWTCPSCKRRVPNRIDTCHCGTTRAQAVEMTAAEQRAADRPAPAAWTPKPRPVPRQKLGWDIKGLIIGLVVVCILALVWLLVPWKPDSVVPVLGIQVPAPPGKATPKPRAPATPRPPTPTPR
jgi:hypothetical protein